MQSAAATQVHEPFSRSLGRIIERERGDLTSNGNWLHATLRWLGMPQ